MNNTAQIRVMESQLSCFDSLIEKMQYMSYAFDPNPMFTKEARDTVRANIRQSLKDKARIL